MVLLPLLLMSSVVKVPQAVLTFQFKGMRIAQGQRSTGLCSSQLVESAARRRGKWRGIIGGDLIKALHVVFKRKLSN